MVFSREIERKFTLKDTTYEDAHNTLSCLSRCIINASSFDTYWKAYGVDFVRLRDNSREITVKVTDKHTVVDRIEENVEVVKESMPAAARFLTLLLGPPAMKITKRFSVFEVSSSPAPGTEVKAILCLYVVEEDPRKRIFFEVEAESLAIVDYVLRDIIPKEGFNLKKETSSLFQIFHKKVKAA